MAWVNVSKRNGHGGGRSVRGAAGGDRQPCVCQGADGPGARRRRRRRMQRKIFARLRRALKECV